ncbi:MAG: hypothetical protein JO010_15220, partial [Alphaproteobacteria bacterium]|nr:hypothetical protein [Alphaproteobacteria bacterium]
MAASGAALFVGTAVIELHGGYDFLESWPTLGYGLGAALMIFAIASLEDGHRIVRVPAPLVFIGAASYSIYLVHFTVVVGLVKAAHAIGLTEWSQVLPLSLATATTAVMAGFAFHLAAERQLVGAAHRLFIAPARPPTLVLPPTPSLGAPRRRRVLLRGYWHV